MSELRFSEVVQRVVQLRPDGSGSLVAEELYRKANRRGKKGSAMVRPFDRALRRLARAQEATADTYLERHDRSNAKRRDGWLIDLNDNVWRASRKGLKTLKLRRLILPG